MHDEFPTVAGHPLTAGPSGKYIVKLIGGEQVRAFVPAPLPVSPPIPMDSIMPLLGRADRALGRLDGLSQLLPDPHLFLYAYIRKEALLSSQIEGTQSTLTDLFALEAGETGGTRMDEVQQVSNYAAAMQYGMDHYATLSLSLRLIREVHAVLLRSGTGAAYQPGAFRTTQNWIMGTRPGNAMYVPPPPAELMRCLYNLEDFLNSVTPFPPLVRAGIAHVQFESIHPFSDGNGRIGRLLVTLMLCADGVLGQPLLYLSLYFKTHRQEYYRLLQAVRERSAWYEWLSFFLTGVETTASQAVAATRRIIDLIEADRQRIEAESDRTGSVLRVHDQLKRRVWVAQKSVSEQTGLSPPTVNAAFEQLLRLGIVREITGRRRSRVYIYDKYVTILNEGAEPLPR